MWQRLKVVIIAWIAISSLCAGIASSSVPGSDGVHPLGTVKITVKNPAGQPIPGADVRVSNLLISFSNVTDGNGDAVFDLNPGVYMVSATHSSYQPGARYFKVSGALTLEITLLDAGSRDATLHGAILDGVTGSGVPGVNLVFERMDMRYVNRTVSDLSGNYSVRLIPGWYLVSTNRSGYLNYSEVTYVAGSVRHEVVIAPLSGVTGHVSGTVMDLFTGKGAVGGRVRAYGPGGWWTETIIGSGGAYSMNVLNTNVKLFAMNSSKSNFSKSVSSFPATVNFNLERDTDAPIMGCTPYPLANISLLNPIRMKGWIKDNYGSISVWNLMLGRFLRGDANDEYYSVWSEFAEDDNPRMYAIIPADFTGTDMFNRTEYNFTWNATGTYGMIGDPSFLKKDDVSFALSPRTGGLLYVYGEVISPRYNHTPAVAVFPREGGPVEVIIANVTGASELIYPQDEPATLFAKRNIIYRVNKQSGDVSVFEESGMNTYALQDLTANLREGIQSGRYAVLGHTEDFAMNKRTSKWSEFTVDTDPPRANAGPDERIYAGNTTYLDGSNSSDNVGIVLYEWMFVDNGQNITLKGKNVSYKFSNTGRIEVTLTVTDGGLNTNSDLKVIDVIPVPPDTEKPVAIADVPERATPMTTVTFDGHRSHDNVGISQYWWTWVDTRGEHNESGVIVKTNFTSVGRYAITLTVCDAAGNCDSDTKSLVITTKPNDQIPPIPDAGGDRSVIQKGLVRCPAGLPNIEYPGVLIFDASHSNGTGSSIIRYEWTITDPLGNENNYSGAVINITFLRSGVHTVRLEVWDEGLNPASTVVYVTVLPFDSNADGLPDDWAIRYFGSITKYRGNEDPDRDGYNNIEELCRNSDPTIPDTENRPRTFASDYWWLFIVAGIIILIIVVGIAYARRPTLLEPEEAPAPPPQGPAIPAGFAPPVPEEPAPQEKVEDKEEEELKEILEGKWDKPKEEELS